jgi:DNA-binding transcriptional MerR regulator
LSGSHASPPEAASGDADAAFTALQAARLSGCTQAQLDYWERCGLVVRRAGGSGPYAFRDLVALRMVRSLLDAGLPLADPAGRGRLLQAGEDVVGLRMVTDGERVWACRDDGQILDALRHGQLALFVAVDKMAAELEAEVREFSRDRQSFVDVLRHDDHPAGSG